MLELDKKIKNLLFLLFKKPHYLYTLLKLTILKNELLFYITNNIKKFTIFYYLYMSALCLRKLTTVNVKILGGEEY